MAIRGVPPPSEIVWDFDGVLADSRGIAWKTGSEILRLLGSDIEIEDQEVFRDNFVRPVHRNQQETELLASMHRLVMKSRANQIGFFPVLDLVSEIDVPSRIVTSGLGEVARLALGQGSTLFEAIEGREHGKKTELLQGIPKDAIFITDTGVDVRRALEQGLLVAAVAWGYDPVSVLLDNSPTFMVHSRRDLSKLFQNLQVMSPKQLS